MSCSNQIRRLFSNLFYKVVTVAILWPCVTSASEEVSVSENWGVDQEDTDSYRLGRERLERFNEIDPFLRKEEGDTSRRFITTCTQVNRSCLRYLRDEKADARRAVPDNPEYWKSYIGLLEATPLARLPADFDDEPLKLHGIINATKNWAMNQLLVRGTLDAEELHFVVNAHRRLLAESNFLYDKVIFLPTSAISLQAVNTLMAQHAHNFPPLEPAEAELLDEMLQPMSRAEYSMRKSFHGESQFMAERAKDGVIDESQLEEIYQVYRYVTDRSEASWAEFWEHGVDVLADVPISTFDWSEGIAGYSDYPSSMRHVDANLYLLRALREIYEGRASPGIPAQPPPARWHWQWQVANQALCLTPGDIHVSFRNVGTICIDYLEENDVAM